jgi:hypothetical protein
VTCKIHIFIIIVFVDCYVIITHKFKFPTNIQKLEKNVQYTLKCNRNFYIFPIANKTKIKNDLTTPCTHMYIQDDCEISLEQKVEYP